MKSKIEQLFDKLFDDSDYKPHPISLEGYEAYKQKKPISKCPYTDSKSKELWRHGWNVTDVGHINAASYGGVYDDPKNWK